MRYRATGKDGAPVVLMTHGAGLDHRVFEPQIAALSGRYRIVTWDLPAERGRLSVAGLADEVIAILDDLRAATAVLVGHSMGGDVCQEAVFRHPDRVSALVVISSVRLFAARGIRERLLARLRPWKIRLSSLEAFRQATAAAVTADPAVRSYVLECMRRLTARETAALWDAIARAHHAEPGYRFPCPFMAVVGADDRLGGGFIPCAARVWVELEREARLAVIAGAGHLPTLERPDAVNEALLAFIDGCAIPPGSSSR